MAISCNYYDILLHQGQTYFLSIAYSDEDDNLVDLRGTTYRADMQVRRSPLVAEMLLYLSSDGYPNGATGGGITGQFLGTTADPGVTGTGGITLNYGGDTGALRLEVDYVTTGNIPPGRHFYDIGVKNKVTNTVDKIMTGTIEVLDEVTR